MAACPWEYDLMVRIAVSLVLAASAGTGLAQPAVSSGDVPRAQFITVQDGEFRKMDADKNGQVTRIEVEAFQRLTAVATAQIRNRQLFAQLDVDRNGQISPLEFLKLNPPPPPVNGQPFVAQLDLNRDGQISLVEHRTARLANFDKMDTDKDGVVTVAEMRAAGLVK